MQQFRYVLSVVCLFLVLVAGCSKPKDTAAGKIADLRRFPLDSLEGVITLSNVTIDTVITSDGRGSLRVDATKPDRVGEPTVVRLFETGDIDIEDATLVYRAKVRTEDVQGQVYLEMWCSFPGMGEFFSRGLMTPLKGTTDWTTQETVFFLKKGENPDNVRINLVIEGTGTAWIDDVVLTEGDRPR
ncbi:MAG: hypothetical protein V2A71_04335 [Candidatus Eisenbacteria bacterium]